jgi:hypothetical protein
VLPWKGRLSKKAQQIKNSEKFLHARCKHAAVESEINALENHGLDRCPDHGVHGFRRYVGLAVLSRNIQQLGAILQKQAIEKMRRRRKAAGGSLRLAA